MDDIFGEEELKAGTGDYYWVSDIGLAAVLMMNGYNFSKIDVTNSSSVVFGFIQERKLEKMIKEYYEKKLVVEPVMFQGQLASLKKRINLELNNQ